MFSLAISEKLTIIPRFCGRDINVSFVTAASVGNLGCLRINSDGSIGIYINPGNENLKVAEICV